MRADVMPSTLPTLPPGLDQIQVTKHVCAEAQGRSQVPECVQTWRPRLCVRELVSTWERICVVGLGGLGDSVSLEQGNLHRGAHLHGDRNLSRWPMRVDKCVHVH